MLLKNDVFSFSAFSVLPMFIASHITYMLIHITAINTYRNFTVPIISNISSVFWSFNII